MQHHPSPHVWVEWGPISAYPALGGDAICGISGTVEPGLMELAKIVTDTAPTNLQTVHYDFYFNTLFPSILSWPGEGVRLLKSVDWMMVEHVPCELLLQSRPQ